MIRLNAMGFIRHKSILLGCSKRRSPHDDISDHIGPPILCHVVRRKRPQEENVTERIQRSGLDDDNYRAPKLVRPRDPASVEAVLLDLEDTDRDRN